MQSVPGTKVVSSIPAHDEVYSTLCHIVCQLLVAGWWFSPSTPPPIKLAATIWLKYNPNPNLTFLTKIDSF
jgi:hypothetical protein